MCRKCTPPYRRPRATLRPCLYSCEVFGGGEGMRAVPKRRVRHEGARDG